MTNKTFTAATGNWTVNDAGNITYTGGSTEVNNLKIDSGVLTAQSEIGIEYELTDQPGRGILWQNPVNGTFIAACDIGASWKKSTDGGKTWKDIPNPLSTYLYIKQSQAFYPGVGMFATNKTGDITVFVCGEDNHYTTDDGESWVNLGSTPKGNVEDNVDVVYDEANDIFRVYSGLNGDFALAFNFDGSDPSTYIDNSFNQGWQPRSRALILDNGKVLFRSYDFSTNDRKPDGTMTVKLALLKNLEGVASDNTDSIYTLELDNGEKYGTTTYASLAQGKNQAGERIVAIAYVTNDSKIGIRYTKDGINWTDISDLLNPDLPLLNTSGYVTIMWCEERLEWYVLCMKPEGTPNSADYGTGYIFKTSTGGDLTSLYDVTRNALVPAKADYVIGNDNFISFSVSYFSKTNFGATGTKEVVSGAPSLYWDGEKLATTDEVKNIIVNTPPDLSNYVELQNPLGSTYTQKIDTNVQVGGTKLLLGKANSYGNVDQFNHIHVSDLVVTQLGTSDDYRDQNTISILRLKEYNEFPALSTTQYYKWIFKDTIKSDSTIQATDFLDADGNSIMGGGSDYLKVDTDLKNLEVGTLPIVSGGEGYCVAVGMQANFGGYVKDNSVGIGVDAKAVTNAVAVGLGTEARPNAIAIGRSAQAWDNAMAIGSATWAQHDYSIAIGKNAKTEEAQQVMFGATPDNPYGKPVNLKTYGTMQATDFLDADGESIIGAGGITAEFDPSFVYEEPWKGEEVGAGPVWVVGDGLSASLLHTDGHLVATTSEFRSVKAINIDTHAPFYGSVSSGNGFFTEATVFGGINITALDQARPEELPFDLTDEEANAFKSQSRSIQYALTVTHETLGRTVEIDKEGIIRANQFTDMDGNPIGGGGGDPEWADIQFNLGPDDYALAVTSSGGLSVGPLTNLVHPTGIALGREASSDQFGLAAGFKANAGAFNSIAFGYRADSKHQYSIALGHAATTTKDSQLKISPNITEVDFSSAVVQAKDYLDANGDSIKVDLSNYPQSTTVNNFVTLTQSQYNLLPNKDSNTIYFIQE